MGNPLIFTRCLAVISMRNLASERTLVYSLGFAALLNEAVSLSNLRGSKVQVVNRLGRLVQIQSFCARSRSRRLGMLAPVCQKRMRVLHALNPRRTAHARYLASSCLTFFLAYTFVGHNFMFGHLLLQNETYTDHVTNAAQIIRLSVMFLVLYRHLKSLFLNYHHLFLSFLCLIIGM